MRSAQTATLRLLLLRLLLLGGAVAGEWSVAAARDPVYPITVARVVDGDTIIAQQVVLPYGVALVDRPFRLLSYDAFESRRGRASVGEITDAEIAKGQEAKAALETLLKDATACYIAPGDEEQDNYGRLLGRLYVQKGKQLIDVAAWMRQHDFDRDVWPDGKPRK